MVGKVPDTFFNRQSGASGEFNLHIDAETGRAKFQDVIRMREKLTLDLSVWSVTGRFGAGREMVR